MFSFCLCRRAAMPALLLLLSHRQAEVQRNKGSVAQSQQLASRQNMQMFALTFIHDLHHSSMERTIRTKQKDKLLPLALDRRIDGQTDRQTDR